MLYYANGYFKAKSTKILTKGQLETLIAKNDEKFFELLRNYGFGFADSVEDLYIKEIKRLQKDLKDALGDLKSLKVFFYPYDILNTKLIYKQIRENIKTEEFYLDAGNIDPHYIYQALKYGKFIDFSEYEKMFLKIKNIKERDYQKVNYLIDSLFVDKMHEVVKGSKALTDYLNVKLDITNFLTIIRVKKLNLGKDFLEQAIFKTNSLSKKEFIDLYDKSIEEIAKKANNLGYFTLRKSIEEYGKKEDLETLESNFLKDLFKILIDYSFASEGLGFIMSYVYQKLMELKNIKIIYYNRTTSLNKLFILGE